MQFPSLYMEALRAMRHFLTHGVTVSMADPCGINIAAVLFSSHPL